MQHRNSQVEQDALPGLEVRRDPDPDRLLFLLRTAWHEARALELTLGPAAVEVAQYVIESELRSAGWELDQ